MVIKLFAVIVSGAFNMCHLNLKQLIAFIFMSMTTNIEAFDPVKDGSTARNLTDANEHCRSNGYELLSIHNDDQMDAAEQVCGSGWCWIGLVMDETTGEWSWTDGTKLDYGFDGDGNPTKGVWPWRSGEPSFSNSNEFSTRLIVGKGWNDFYENVSDHPIMCNNGTLAPTVEPTPDPTKDPTTDPTSDPTFEPTLEPTTKCDPLQSCTECLDMNSDGVTWCFWDSADDECSLVTLQSDLTSAITDESSCPIVNELCDDSTWNEVSGDWTFDADQCSLYSTGGGLSNKGIVWLGSSDGKTPDKNYCHPYFVLQASVFIDSGNRLGISFRSETSSDTYYLRLNSKNGFVGIYQLSDDVTIDDTDALYFANVGITIDTMYNVTIIGGASVYDIYLNGENVLNGITLTDLTNYNNCSIGIKAWNSEVTFLSLTYNGADTAFPTNAPTTSPTYMPTYIPTPFPTDPTSEPSNAPTFSPSNAPSNAPSIAPSDTPSDFPSNAPSNAPSKSPTRYPIAYSEFDPAVTAIFNITGWTTSEVTTVNNDWKLFTSSLTEYIHQGFDEDPDLEFRYIVPNVTYINDVTVDELIMMDSNDIGSILWGIIANGMKLQYLIECSAYIYCVYVAESDPFVGMNRTAFEDSVSADVNMYFMSGSANAEPPLSFTVESMTVTNDDDAVSYGESSDSTFTVIFILGGLAVVFICGISLGVILLHFKRKRTTDQNVGNAPNEGDKKQNGAVDSESGAHTPRSGSQNPEDPYMPPVPHPRMSVTNVTEDTIRRDDTMSRYGDGEGQEGVEMTGTVLPMNRGATGSENKALDLPKQEEMDAESISHHSNDAENV